MGGTLWYSELPAITKILKYLNLKWLWWGQNASRVILVCPPALHRSQCYIASFLDGFEFMCNQPDWSVTYCIFLYFCLVKFSLWWTALPISSRVSPADFVEKTENCWQDIGRKEAYLSQPKVLTLTQGRAQQRGTDILCCFGHKRYTTLLTIHGWVETYYHNNTSYTFSNRNKLFFISWESLGLKNHWRLTDPKPGMERRIHNTSYFHSFGHCFVLSSMRVSNMIGQSIT